MSACCRLELTFLSSNYPSFSPLGKKAQSSSGHVLHFKVWKRWASSDSLRIGSLSENKDLHLLLPLHKGVWFAANSVGHQRVKHNMKNYLKSLSWAPTLLGYCSHKTQPQEIRLQSCSACRIVFDSKRVSQTSVKTNILLYWIWKWSKPALVIPIFEGKLSTQRQIRKTL